MEDCELTCGERLCRKKLPQSIFAEVQIYSKDALSFRPPFLNELCFEQSGVEFLASHRRAFDARDERDGEKVMMSCRIVQDSYSCLVTSHKFVCAVPASVCTTPTWEPMACRRLKAQFWLRYRDETFCGDCTSILKEYTNDKSQLNARRKYGCIVRNVWSAQLNFSIVSGQSYGHYVWR